MKKIFFILFLASVFSCEQVVEIDVPDHTPELVLSSYYTNDSLSISADIRNSLPILSSIQTRIIDGATVELFEDDVLIATLLQNASGESYTAELNQALSRNKRYQIKASAPGFETIYAEQELPQEVAITAATYTPSGGRDLDGFVTDEIEITFTDPSEEENYYQVMVYHRYKMGAGQMYGAWTWSLDPIFEEGWTAPLFRDDVFDGQTRTIKILADEADYLNYDVIIVLSHISRSKYLLSKSLLAQSFAQDNPFAEPVIVHTNVENGQGVFSMESSSVWEF